MINLVAEYDLLLMRLEYLRAEIRQLIKEIAKVRKKINGII